MLNHRIDRTPESNTLPISGAMPEPSLCCWTQGASGGGLNGAHTSSTSSMTEASSKALRSSSVKASSTWWRHRRCWRHEGRLTPTEASAQVQQMALRDSTRCCIVLNNGARGRVDAPANLLCSCRESTRNDEHRTAFEAANFPASDNAPDTTPQALQARPFGSPQSIGWPGERDHPMPNVKQMRAWRIFATA